MEKLLQPPFLWIILGAFLILDIFFIIKADRLKRPNLIIQSIFTIVILALCILVYA